jgi:hypothetical protein
MTKMYPHCGKCSQCIDRRFAVLAASQEGEDPGEAYSVDLLLGKREAGPDREMALSFVRSASIVNQMQDVEFFGRYGETSRVVGYFQEPATTVAGRIVGLYRRHAKAVCDVFDDTIKASASKIREGTLAADCLLSLVVGQGGERSAYRAPGSPPAQRIMAAQEIRMSIVEDGKRVVFQRWGELQGANADLIIALAELFRSAARKELSPERYPFFETSKLKRRLNCGSDEVLRRRVLRCRNKIKKLAKDVGEVEPSIDAIIENSRWHGYRLNPDRVRLMAHLEF